MFNNKFTRLWGKINRRPINGILHSIRFIYKNSSEPDTLTSKGGLLKFFKSAAEKLRYLFTGETDQAKKDKQETPTDHTIGLEIYVNGKQIDIPIGTLTNPATLKYLKLSKQF